MKKKFLKTLLSATLTLTFVFSIISSIPFSAKAAYEAYFLDGRIANEATFILDPGHGGEDPGALGPVEADGSRREEADANLSMALKVAAELERRGETVALTRITDKTVALIDRSHISNAGNYKIFCSLHRNSYSDPAAHGIVTFYYNGLNSDSPSAKIANKVHENIIATSSEMYNRGVKSENFSVLRETNTCAILIESLFISSPSDNLLYDKLEGDLAVAIANGLIESKKFVGASNLLDGVHSPVDLGDSFIAAITLPYANLALTNNGNLNTVASTTDYSDSQLWKFEKIDSSNAYKITSLLDNKCLDVDSAGTANGTNVMIWDDNGASCQKYYLYSINEKYCIKPKHCSEDRVLDINAVSLNAQIYDLILTNPNQQFVIEKIEDKPDDTPSGEPDSSGETSEESEKTNLQLIEGSKYNLENETVTKVKANTKADEFSTNFKHEVIIKDVFDNELSSDTKVGTGCIVYDKYSGEKATIIILGDVNGDGELNATDYLQIKSFFLSISSLDGVYFTAANVDCQGSIDATDYIKVKSHFLGSVDIYE